MINDENSDRIDINAVDNTVDETLDLPNKLDFYAEVVDDTESLGDDDEKDIDVTLPDQAIDNPRASTKSDHALPQNLSRLPRERSSTPFSPL